MENWSSEEAVDSLGVQLKNKRSILLTVVCILTWVGCAYTLVITGLALANSNVLKSFTGLDHYSGLWFFCNWLVFPILCSVGALLMFLLKRWGFWIYCLGQIPPVAYSIYAIIGLVKNLGPGIFFGLLMNCLSIGFIVIYAVEMNKLSRKPVSTDF
jgi:hypothetical protein